MLLSRPITAAPIPGRTLTYTSRPHWSPLCFVWLCNLSNTRRNLVFFQNRHALRIPLVQFLAPSVLFLKLHPRYFASITGSRAVPSGNLMVTPGLLLPGWVVYISVYSALIQRCSPLLLSILAAPWQLPLILRRISYRLRKLQWLILKNPIGRNPF